jgi:hypothetical protein
MGATQNTHILTYQTTKPLKCLYFDGMSASLANNGEMDAQMLFIYGNTSGSSSADRWRGLFDEYDRAIKLCEWVERKGLGGLGWGVEGIVRMNAGFEMIVCNFSTPSLKLISHLNVTAPLLGLPETESMDMLASESSDIYPLPTKTSPLSRATNPANPPMPPNWRQTVTREPFLRSQGWQWFVSATWHYGFNGLGPGAGETRVKPLTCGFVSFFSPELLSLQNPRAEYQRGLLNLTHDGLWKREENTTTRKIALQELMRRRRTFRLDDMTAVDAKKINIAMERTLHSLGLSQSKLVDTSACSGIEWDTLTNEITTRYSSGLSELLKTITDSEAVLEQNYTTFKTSMTAIRDRTHSLLVPFMEYPTNPTDVKQLQAVWSRSSTSAKATLSRCKYHYTRLLTPETGVILGPEESLLKSAVEETLGEICNVVVDVGFTIEKIWLSTFNEYDDTTHKDWRSGLEGELKRWRYGVEELMSWLGWAGNWVSCDRSCDVDVSLTL